MVDGDQSRPLLVNREGNGGIMAGIFTKDPNAVLDYAFDWSSWLATSETVSSFVVTVQSGITEGTGAYASSESSGVVTVWLSGGTEGTTYSVACKIVTSAGRTDERTIYINCLNQ